jgi:dTDP-4-amino-4,6-dideoxygalactose transaminase
VLVDVEPETHLIDLDDAARCHTPNCTAIMPVHFGGLPCDMDAIRCFARQNGLKVIEDAAHAFPAHRNGRLVGTGDSDACVFSFYANKPITTVKAECSSRAIKTSRSAHGSCERTV